MTTEKRYQVFVSSTYEDLREARQEVMQALLELDCIPAGMELFPAASEDQWTLIRGVIDDCDYYVVIIAGRYGSVGPKGLSYTEMEYDYAISSDKPVIAFLHKDPGTLPSNKCEKTLEARSKLEAFRARVQQKMCRLWDTPADLGSVVSRSLVKLIKVHPAIGWVRADRLPEQSATEEILRLRNRVETLQAQLEQTMSAPPSATEHLAQGEDTISLRYSFTAKKKNRYRVFEYKDTFSAAWNDLFSVISPLLIDEASDRAVKHSLDSFVKNENSDRLGSQRKGYELERFSLNDEDFNTIKVQFLALRMMMKSAKKKARSVSDRNAYWTLTPYGESVMVSLRAIQRQDMVGGDDASTRGKDAG